MAWVAVTTVRYYPDGSYDVEQLPIRLLFLGITSALVMLLVHRLNRERQQVQALNRDLEGRVAERTLELAEANKEMEAFSYSVAHDLRSPLTAIRGFAELLSMEERGLNSQQREYIQSIITESKRLSSTIEDLLRLSGASKEEIKKQEVDLSKLVLDVAHRLQQRDANRKATVNVGPAAVAHCDPGLMRRVVENVVGNAWKYTSMRDQAVIEFGCRREANGERVFYVKDNGVGFNPALADQVFRPFVRLNGDPRFQGTGVGLATVERIIRRHGGRVWAEGNPGKGATIYWTLG